MFQPYTQVHAQHHLSITQCHPMKLGITPSSYSRHFLEYHRVVLDILRCHSKSPADHSHSYCVWKIERTTHLGNKYSGVLGLWSGHLLIIRIHIVCGRLNVRSTWVINIHWVCGAGVNLNICRRQVWLGIYTYEEKARLIEVEIPFRRETRTRHGTRFANLLQNT